MHQQSDKENPSSDPRYTEAGDAVASEIDLDSVAFPDLTLPDFLSRFTAEDADSNESLGTLTHSLTERVFGIGDDRDIGTRAVVSPMEAQSGSARYETSIDSLLTSFMAARSMPSSSVSASVASALQWGHLANVALADANADGVVDQGERSADIGAAGRHNVSGSLESGHPTAPQADPAKRIAHLIRLVASVVSREIIPGESHRPPPGARQYDPRALLVAAYRLLSEGGPFTMTKFSGLAGEIGPKRLSGWNGEFKDDLDAPRAFWARLGFGDAQATIEQLEALRDETAPAPTLRDLKASPLYRRLTLIKQSGISTAQLKRENRTRQVDVSMAPAKRPRDTRAMPSHSRVADVRPQARINAPRDAAPRSAYPVSLHAHGASTQSRPDNAIVPRSHVATPIVQDVSPPVAVRHRTAAQDAAAQRLARLIRIVGSVVSREVIPNESHRPLPGERQYDPRALLVAAYRLLSNGQFFTMTTFSGLAGEIGPKRFSDWNKDFDDKLDASFAFWWHLGFGDAGDVQATVEQLEKLNNDAAPAPTLEDLAASPFYRKLTLTKQSGVSSAQRKRTFLSYGDDVSRGNATRTSGAQSIRSHTASAAPQVPYLSDSSADLVPWSEMPVSFDAVIGDRSDGAVSKSQAKEAVAGLGNVHAAIGPDVSGGRYSTETRTDVAQKIARYIRMIGSVVRGEMIPDASPRSVPSQTAFDPRLLLVAAYSVLSKRDDASRHPRFFSKSKFSGLAGAIPGNSFIRWTHRFAGELETSRAFWAHLGLDEATDNVATIGALQAMHDVSARPTSQDLVDSPFYGRLTSLHPSADTLATSKKAARKPADATAIPPWRHDASQVGASMARASTSQRCPTDYPEVDFSSDDMRASMNTPRPFVLSEPLRAVAAPTPSHAPEGVASVPDNRVGEDRDANIAMVLAAMQQALASSQPEPDIDRP